MISEPHPSKDIIASISSRLSGKKVALGITGSVAAVKSSDIARLLMRYGVEVYPFMTEEACRLIHPNLMEWATGNPVITGLTGKIEHVHLAGNVPTRVDAVLIAPATANTIGKIAAGIDDTPVTTLVTTALGQGIPLILVPAMHEPMYKHPAVLRNLEILKDFGVDILMPNIAEGKAKIPEVEEVVFRTLKHLRRDGKLHGTRWLVTAGRTVEFLDPIRVLTNNSSGKMGMEIARALFLAGAEVDVVYGKGTAREVPQVNIHRVSTAEQMLEEVKRLAEMHSINGMIAAAAVGDWQPKEMEKDKISTRSSSSLSIELKPTPKIIDQVKKLSPSTYLVAFRALYKKSVEELAEDGKQRMSLAGADMIAVNDIGREGAGFEVNTNELHLYNAKGEYTHIELSDKFSAAEKLVDKIIENFI